MGRKIFRITHEAFGPLHWVRANRCELPPPSECEIAFRWLLLPKRATTVPITEVTPACNRTFCQFVPVIGLYAADLSISAGMERTVKLSITQKLLGLLGKRGGVRIDGVDDVVVDFEIQLFEKG